MSRYTILIHEEEDAEWINLPQDWDDRLQLVSTFSQIHPVHGLDSNFTNPYPANVENVVSS